MALISTCGLLFFSLSPSHTHTQTHTHTQAAIMIATGATREKHLGTDKYSLTTMKKNNSRMS